MILLFSSTPVIYQIPSVFYLALFPFPSTQLAPAYLGPNYFPLDYCKNCLSELFASNLSPVQTIPPSIHHATFLFKPTEDCHVCCVLESQGGLYPQPFLDPAYISSLTFHYLSSALQFCPDLVALAAS